MIPRLVISAPASGCGKTTVATGLMAALRTRGVVVSGHKAGPDYIDPGYHALATGRAGRNLDPFLCGEDLIGPLFVHGAAGADIAVIEGAMGLFDGVADAASAGEGAGPDFASTAHVARLLRAPVVLVVDAAAAGRSVAAVVAGFAGFDPRVRVAGVIFNRVGSDRHERLLRDAVESLGIGVFGAIRRTDAVVTPSRHLGLVPAAERRGAAERAVEGLAGLIASSCDLNGLRALAATASPLASRPWDPHAALAAAASAATPMAHRRGHNNGDGPSVWLPEPGIPPQSPSHPPSNSPSYPQSHTFHQALAQSRWSPADASSPSLPRSSAAEPVIAVAQGPAFTFSYAEHAELLAAAGVRIAPFDPLADETLPAGTAGLVIGGGFPEMYAPELSGNAPLRRQVAALAAAGAPIVAECAGLLYLARTLDGMPMCGVIEADTHMTPRLTLGYRTAAAMSDSVLARVGDHVRGHEFHRTAATPVCGRQPAWQRTSGRTAGGSAAGGSAAGGSAAGGCAAGGSAAGGCAAGGLPAEGHVAGNVLASYLHLHWAHTPVFALRLAAACGARGATVTSPPAAGAAQPRRPAGGAVS
ncbi:MAG TPA: cobyrinate a,c-diamide synthase [Streptosporangiaceae bacterium]|nr:cobyrinate a,c-diamide synthase [Streptosporangiaceae bacterium]